MVRFYFIMMIFAISAKAQNYCDSVKVWFQEEHWSYYKLPYNPFEETEDTELEILYLKSSGNLYTIRIGFVIEIIDSNIFFRFYTPETDEYNEIDYNKSSVLSKKQYSELKKIVLESDIFQKIVGIPDPPISMFEKERLRIKYKDIKIYGGMFNYLEYGNLSEEDRNTIVNCERKLTSSIGGDYDQIINWLQMQFEDLDKLMKEAYKYDQSKNNYNKIQKTPRQKD